MYTGYFIPLSTYPVGYIPNSLPERSFVLIACPLSSLYSKDILSKDSITHWTHWQSDKTISVHYILKRKHYYSHPKLQVPNKHESKHQCFISATTLKL